MAFEFDAIPDSDVWWLNSVALSPSSSEATDEITSIDGYGSGNSNDGTDAVPGKVMKNRKYKEMEKYVKQVERRLAYTIESEQHAQGMIQRMQRQYESDRSMHTLVGPSSPEYFKEVHIQSLELALASRDRRIHYLEHRSANPSGLEELQPFTSRDRGQIDQLGLELWKCRDRHYLGMSHDQAIATIIRRKRQVEAQARLLHRTSSHHIQAIQFLRARLEFLDCGLRDSAAMLRAKDSYLKHLDDCVSRLTKEQAERTKMCGIGSARQARKRKHAESADSDEV